LMDYNRERIHLSQFFSAEVIDELLRDPRYAEKYLTPRDEEVGILFADINSFTRISELVLESPSRIGRFVDRWSDAMVRVLWKHGGVFDKMVGDCVIGLFGPPFFRSSRVERAEAALRAAQEIQQLTQSMSSDPEVVRLAEMVKLPGLGVAVGVNLAHTYCGIFGPNKQYTGFSTGMNSTARLQSLGGFREILVMESVKQALQQSRDPALLGLSYGELTETPVKNVAQPLRHHRLLAPK
jgi:adenylate cyclase